MPFAKGIVITKLDFVLDLLMRNGHREMLKKNPIL